MRSGFQFLVSKYDAQGSCATYVTANFKRVYLKMACSHMLLSCNIHMYYLRPATLAFVRRFRREAALAGAAVRVMGVPVRVNACAAAAKSKAEKAQRIMVPRPLFFPVHSHMPHSVGTQALAFSNSAERRNVHDWCYTAKAMKRAVNISARVHDLQNFVALLQDTRYLPHFRFSRKRG